MADEGIFEAWGQGWRAHLSCFDLFPDVQLTTYMEIRIVLHYILCPLSFCSSSIYTLSLRFYYKRDKRWPPIRSRVCRELKFFSTNWSAVTEYLDLSSS